MHELIIRGMREEDIPAVLEIEQISFSTPCTEQFFLAEIYKKYAVSRVALFEGKVIGYVCADYRLHESHVLTLAVHPNYRRRGVATVLMDEAIRDLKERGCVFLYLKVRASNAGAREFYEHLGFKVEGIRKKYYDIPEEDALVMTARL